MITFNSIKML